MVAITDDLHLLTEQDTLDGLAYVLRNATPGLRLVVSSRMDPPAAPAPIPAHSRHELTEIRADDLAFSVPESAMLMRPAGHHAVRRTRSSASLCGLEGWAAGIRLAAISLHGHPDSRAIR